MRSNILNTWVIVALCAWSAVAGAEPATVVFVDATATGAHDGSSWTDACTSLQDGLAAAAQAGKPVEVRVAQGVYKPDQGAGITPGDRAATFWLLNGVTLKGGYAGLIGPDPNARDIELHATILSGDLAGNDDSTDQTVHENSSHVVTASGTDPTAVMDGFTIAGGSRWHDVNSAPSSSAGGEAVLIEAGSPTIRNCCFTGNYGSIIVGIVSATSGSHPALTNCAFVNNPATGMFCFDSSDAVLTRCRFEGNEWEDLDIRGSSPVLTDCTFTGTDGYAIDASDCNSVLTNCVFQGRANNRWEQGIHYSGNLSLTGCTFTGLRGVAVEAMGDLTLMRCTFRGNGGAVDSIGFGGTITALECAFLGNRGGTAGAISGGDMRLHDCEFAGNSGFVTGAAAARGSGVLTITGCVFSGNSARGGPGAIDSRAEATLVSNCTFADNRGSTGVLGFWPGGGLPGKLTQCVIREGVHPFGVHPWSTSQVNVTYSDIQDGFPGQGNIDVDPCFVDPGYWDPNGTPDDPNDDFWVAGDYHLKSQGGHWDRATESWVRDDVTSPCIDAGDPNNPLGVEPFPNGGVINMGAYGGSDEASKSYFGEPVCEFQIPGDINGDCKVNQTDIDILMAHWLMEAAGFVDIPPTVMLLSPQDGAELTYPTPIIFQCTASDPDGTVVRVKYTLEHREGNGRSTGSTMTTDPANNWQGRWQWSYVQADGTYTMWAEAMDNEGARTASPKITVTLHPAP
jgi:hypothetical protein